MEQSVPLHLSPIKQLFSESWQVFTKSVLRLFIIAISNILLNIFLLALAILGAVLVIGPSVIGKLFSGKGSSEVFTALFTPQFFISMGVLFFAYLFVLMLIGIFVYVAEILAVDRHDQPFSFGLVLSKFTVVLIPLIAMQFLLFVLLFGSFFVFVFPAMLFGFFLMFAQYEIIINNQGAIASLKRSTLMVTRHFGGILGRVLLFWLLTVCVLQIIPSVIMQIDSTTGAYIMLLTIPLQVFFMWFGIAYAITLYKQARGGLEAERGSSMWWMWLVALLGWIIFAGVVYGGYKMMTSEQMRAMMASMTADKNAVQQEEKLTFVPSSCGLEVTLPKTKDTYKGQKRQWVLDEVRVSKENFKALSPQNTPIDNPQTTYVWYKDPNEKILDENGDYYLTFPGIDIMCIDNTRGLTLDTYKGLVLANSGITVKESEEKPYRTKNGVILEFVLLQGKGSDGKAFEDPAYLGVSKDGKKLFYIRFWPAVGKDPKAKTINADEDLMFSTLRYGITGTLPTPTIQQTTQRVAPPQTYVAPTIAPGALGSKEWQEEFDRKFKEAQAATGN
ncbi:MAG: hypothetical protein KBD46_03630 [Candidatus Levybacteria bacterium]|nr:hypothetical protein [Candidatus Levybacteria bacterium]